ncbi:MAG: DUF2269 family protein [Bacilli bacterium]|nr:DUF2269 family protein [Bacilli bacterium]
MNNFYVFIVFTHVLSAVVSVGPLFALFAVLKKMPEADLTTEKAYISIFRSVVRLIKHAGHVLVVTGILLVYLGNWPWTTPWIFMTIALMIVSVFILASSYKGVLKQFDDPNKDRSILIFKLRKATWVYIAILSTMLALMVIKPTFW